MIGAIARARTGRAATAATRAKLSADRKARGGAAAEAPPPGVAAPVRRPCADDSSAIAREAVRLQRWRDKNGCPPNWAVRDLIERLTGLCRTPRQPAGAR